MITRMTRMLYRFIHLESLVNTTYDEERFKDPSVNRQTLGIYKRIDKWTASRFVDHFHSITHTVKAHYVQALHIQPEKISVIFRGRSGINNQRTYKDTGDKIELLNIGRQEFQKGQIYLLQAVHRLRKEGRNVHLKILGREGVATPKMKQFVAEHGLQDQVSFEGYRENVPDYLEAADLFVFPSLYEGLGGALIEAQSYGLPIACNDIPVLREVVVENVNARFFHSEDVDTIVNSIKFFIEDPRKLGEYGKASFSNFQQNFNQDANHEKLLNLYRELCQKYGK
jgi:glycosyltransferase involved in cell wall biosynthesis